jgi:hypothetical protein
MTPNVRTIAGNIEGQITKQQNTKLSCQSSQRLPLPIKMPLQQTVFKQSLLMLSPPDIQSPAFMTCQSYWPLPPRESMMQTAKLHK